MREENGTVGDGEVEDGATGDGEVEDAGRGKEGDGLVKSYMWEEDGGVGVSEEAEVGGVGVDMNWVSSDDVEAERRTRRCEGI